MRCLPWLVVVFLLTPTAMGDVIWTGGGTGRGLRQEVDIIGAEGGLLQFYIFGNRAEVAFERIQQIQIDGQTAFNEAEQAYAAGDWGKAADRYMQVARGNPTEWIRQRGAERLIRAAELAGRFDAAVVGFVQLTLVYPQGAVGREPDARRVADRVDVEAAIEQLEGALSGSVDATQEKLLLTFLLSLQTVAGRDAAAGVTAQRLGALLAPDGSEEPALLAQVVLGRARLALHRGDSPGAVGQIQAQRGLFRQPRHQSQAMLILARAQQAQAGTDPGRLRDAALGYMRVVAHFGRSSTPDDVPEALLAVAEIYEQLGAMETAAGLYGEVVERWPQTAQGSRARDRLGSLPAEALEVLEGSEVGDGPAGG